MINHESDDEGLETNVVDAQVFGSNRNQANPFAGIKSQTAFSTSSSPSPTNSLNATASATHNAILNRFDNLKLPVGTTSTSLTRQHLIAAASVLRESASSLQPLQGEKLFKMSIGFF